MSWDWVSTMSNLSRVHHHHCQAADFPRTDRPYPLIRHRSSLQATTHWRNIENLKVLFKSNDKYELFVAETLHIIALSLTKNNYQMKGDKRILEVFWSLSLSRKNAKVEYCITFSNLLFICGHICAPTMEFLTFQLDLVTFCHLYR